MVVYAYLSCSQTRRTLSLGLQIWKAQRYTFGTVANLFVRGMKQLHIAWKPSFMWSSSIIFLRICAPSILRDVHRRPLKAAFCKTKSFGILDLGKSHNTVLQSIFTHDIVYGIDVDMAEGLSILDHVQPMETGTAFLRADAPWKGAGNLLSAWKFICK